MTTFGTPGLLKMLSPEQRTLLSALGRRATYADGELIHQRGDGDASMGLVISGKIRLVRRLRSGQLLLMTTLSAGQHYGDNHALSPGKPRSHDAIAVGRTVVDHLTHAAFLSLLDHAGIVRALYEVANVRLATAIDLLDDLRALPPEARMARLLLAMHAAGDGDARIACVQEDFSEIMGVSQMTVAKAVRLLKQEGLIETGYRHMIVRDPARMVKWLDAREGE